MTKQEFTDYCLSIGVTPHFREEDVIYKRAGVDYIVALYFKGRDMGDEGASEGDFNRAKEMAEWYAGIRRAAPGSQYEDELKMRGESLLREQSVR